MGFKVFRRVYYKKPITKKEYNTALKIVKEFESYKYLKRIGKW